MIRRREPDRRETLRPRVSPSSDWSADSPALAPTSRASRPSYWTLFIPTDGRPILMNQIARMHWAAVARARHQYRDDTAILARHARIPHLDRVHVIARGVYADRRELPDPDALAPSIKGCIDGLVLAGVITDDCDHHVARVSYDPARRGYRTGIELTIETAA